MRYNKLVRKLTKDINPESYEEKYGWIKKTVTPEEKKLAAEKTCRWFVQKL